jgi:hypothetical protein
MRTKVDAELMAQVLILILTLDSTDCKQLSSNSSSSSSSSSSSINSASSSADTE